MLMSSQDYRESLRRSRPRVYVSGHAVESVADEPSLAPGVNAHRHRNDRWQGRSVAASASAAES